MFWKKGKNPEAENEAHEEHEHEEHEHEGHEHEGHGHEEGELSAETARKNIGVAFLLNFLFVIIEAVGGMLTNSVAILSDAVHDLGDCVTIAGAFFLEKLSAKEPDDVYTYGYRRYSLISAILTCAILIVGGVGVIIGSVRRIFNPQEVDSIGMLIIAVLGVAVNGAAVLKTMKGRKLNEKAISLHMLEDALGWIAVLLGSILIKITGWTVVDPILSIGVSCFVLISAIGTLRSAFSVFLERAPKAFDMSGFRLAMLGTGKVMDVHHVHVWSLDDESNLATMHAVVGDDTPVSALSSAKHALSEAAKTFGVTHMTVQFEPRGEECAERKCRPGQASSHSGHHHHHHH